MNFHIFTVKISIEGCGVDPEFSAFRYKNVDEDNIFTQDAKFLDLWAIVSAVKSGLKPLTTNVKNPKCRGWRK